MITKKAKYRLNPNAEHYVDPEKFLQEYIRHKTAVDLAKNNGVTPPRITDYLGECLMKIAQKLSNSPKFYGYSYREEMVEDAIENMIIYFDRFDPNKDTSEFRSGKISPFNYFTMVAFNAFVRRIMKEERERYTKFKSFQENIVMNVDSEVLEEYGPLSNVKFYENANIFMERYEKREAEKKKKRDDKKREKKLFEALQLIETVEREENEDDDDDKE